MHRNRASQRQWPSLPRNIKGISVLPAASHNVHLRYLIVHHDRTEGVRYALWVKGESAHLLLGGLEEAVHPLSAGHSPEEHSRSPPMCPTCLARRLQCSARLAPEQNLLLLCTSSISTAPVHSSAFWCISLKSIRLAELPELPVGTGIFLSGVSIASLGSGSLRFPSPDLSGGILLPF